MVREVDMKENLKNELSDLLKIHDFFYAFHNDTAALLKGWDQHSRIIELVKQTGLDGELMYSRALQKAKGLEENYG